MSNKTSAVVDAILDDLEAERNGVSPVEVDLLGKYHSSFDRVIVECERMPQEPKAENESMLSKIIHGAFFSSLGF